jgi:hypothetical protein
MLFTMYLTLFICHSTRDTRVYVNSNSPVSSFLYTCVHTPPQGIIAKSVRTLHLSPNSFELLVLDTVTI